MTPKEIKVARAQLGATQQQLADLLGVTRDAVHKWECGERRMSTSRVLLLQEVLNRDG